MDKATQAEAAAINRLPTKEGLAKLAQVDQPERLVPLLRVPLLHALAARKDPALLKIIGSDDAHAGLLKLVHYQSAWLRSQSAQGSLSAEAGSTYLSDYFDEPCFDPLRKSELQIDENAPFKLQVPQDYIELFPAVEQDDMGKWVKAVGLAKTWQDAPSTLEDFKERFDSHTQGIFEGFDWSNVVVAGGSILGLLSGGIKVKPPADEDDPRVDEEEDSVYSSSDIDLFIYDIKTVEDFIAKLRSIIKALTAKVGKKPRVVHLINAISLVWPNRLVIQLVVHNWQDKLSVLDQFDLDAVMHLYDGERVLTNTRGSRFLLSTIAGTAASIFAAANRRSEPEGLRGARVAKWAKRGVSLVAENKIAVEAGVADDGLAAAKAKAKAQAQQAAPADSMTGLLNAFERLEVSPDGMNGDVEDLLVDCYATNSNPAILLALDASAPQNFLATIEARIDQLGDALAAWLRVCKSDKLDSEVIKAVIEANDGLEVYEERIELEFPDGFRPYIASTETDSIIGSDDGASPGEAPVFILRIPKSAAKIVDELQAAVDRNAALKDQSPLLKPLKIEFEDRKDVIGETDTHLFFTYTAPLAATISGFDAELDHVNRILARFYASAWHPAPTSRNDQSRTAFVERAWNAYKPAPTHLEAMVTNQDVLRGDAQALAIILDLARQQAEPDTAVVPRLDADLERISEAYLRPPRGGVEEPFTLDWYDPAAVEWLKVFVDGHRRP